MKHVIIGTAGHVDHGKTTLVKALTGYNTDRLKEEQQRGISIELGFAPFDLPSGRRAGLIDVPGHERFIRHMLAGASGIDLVMLVIAADEGVMPQTQEHLDIVTLLGIKKGIIVLTKCDLVDEEWLEMVEEDIRRTMAGTFLAGAPIMRVSAVTGQGLEELKQAIDRATLEVEEKNRNLPFRLAVDRIFTITGFGTVVTGTVITGSIRVGDRAEILPARQEVRVRNLQVHGQKLEEVVAGQRAALNLAGVEVNEIERGNVVAAPNFLVPSETVDARLRLLGHAPKALENRERIRLYIGSSEVLGRVVLLDRDVLEPGENCLVQFKLEEPIVTARGDHYVIRSYSPMFTLGGGIVIATNTKPHRRFRPEVLRQLELKEKGDPADLIIQTLLTHQVGAMTLEELAKATALGKEEVANNIEKLRKEGRCLVLGSEPNRYIVPAETYRRWEAKILKALEEFHQAYPLKTGMPKEELRTKYFAAMGAKLYAELLQHLEQSGKAAVDKQHIMLAGHKVEFTPAQKAIRDQLEAWYKENLFGAPSLNEVKTKFGAQAKAAEEVFYAMLDQGTLVKISEEIVLHQEAVEKAKAVIKEHFAVHPRLTLSEFRDLLGTSRKYALPLLEYLDATKFTKRLGDERVLY